MPFGFWIAIQYPWSFLVLLILFLLFAAWLLPRLWRGMRTLWRGIGGQGA